jgi:hypothetical protein
MDPGDLVIGDRARELKSGFGVRGEVVRKRDPKTRKPCVMGSQDPPR